MLGGVQLDVIVHIGADFLSSSYFLISDDIAGLTEPDDETSTAD